MDEFVSDSLHFSGTFACRNGCPEERIVSGETVEDPVLSGCDTCPDCAHLSSRIHSRYQRKLADLPWSGRIVRLVVHVSRFFCKHPSCPRKTFAETIPDLTERSARRTTRLKEVLERLGLALGGEGASRLTAILAITCSPDTDLAFAAPSPR